MREEIGSKHSGGGEIKLFLNNRLHGFDQA